MDWSERTDTEYSLGEWAQEYLDYAFKFSDKTYAEKKKTFKEFFRATGSSGKPLVDPSAGVSTLTPGAVLKVLQTQYRHRSGYAANKDRKNLVAAWNWGTKYMNLPKLNPCQVDKFPEVRRQRYVPPEQDFWQVYECATGQDRVMLSVFYYLGARRGEVFRLQWNDIDFEKESVRLGTRKRQEGTLEYDWLPMNTGLKKQLLWWWQNRKFKESLYIFVCEDDCNNFSKEFYGKPFKHRQHFMRSLCEKAGVAYFGFHAIRHLLATKLYHGGKPLSAIQAILRHKNPATTERYLKSLGLEATRQHLEDLCRLKAPARDSEDVVSNHANAKPANVIALADHRRNRSGKEGQPKPFPKPFPNDSGAG
jgi:integrase